MPVVGHKESSQEAEIVTLLPSATVLFLPKAYGVLSRQKKGAHLGRFGGSFGLGDAPRLGSLDQVGEEVPDAHCSLLDVARSQWLASGVAW